MQAKKARPKPWQKYQGVYVHIPFCLQKCVYCDFLSFAGCSTVTMRNYVAALCREIAAQAERPQPDAFALPIAENASIYFGGGTPSLLPTQLLNEIVSTLKKKKFWLEASEATIEANPGTVNLAKLKTMRNLGFDRISFGVQSLNNAELQSLGRVHTAAEALAALVLAKKAGFQRISADVIYGFPGQTMASLKATLESLAKRDLEHLSVYSLTLEQGTPLAAQVARGSLVLPDEDTVADQYELVQEILRAEGFQRYEISNYARNGAYSRHNTVYWQYWPYAAFGVGACAFNGSARRTANVNLQIYNENGRAIYQLEKLSNSQQLTEFLFLGLRRQAGADLFEAQERFGADVIALFGERLQPFMQQGLVTFSEDRRYLRLTERGMAVGNVIFEIFVTA